VPCLAYALRVDSLGFRDCGAEFYFIFILFAGFGVRVVSRWGTNIEGNRFVDVCMGEGDVWRVDMMLELE
jgi:hypothetical protein